MSQIRADNQKLNTYMFFGFLLDFVFRHYKYLMNIIIQYVQKYIILYYKSFVLGRD